MPTTVDKIRRALEKRDGIAEDEMRPLAEDYRTQVQQVNQRLDDAVMLLRKGLRSEAIQRIEMTPNALDAAADLEFPEWDEWNEILQFMGIPLPPKLNQDYVAQINEAIIESLPLDALLRRHRRLAIAKAPLGVRLRTLRQIARVDSSNSVWNDDVESWEKVRLGQIDEELKFALENEDASYLYQLHKELTGGPWRIVPSSRLIEQSAFAAEAHVRKRQEIELGQLAPRINEAFEKRSESEARALRTKWQSSRAKFNVSVPAHLESSVAPAMQWLEDLDRQSVMESERQIAMANLESQLDSGASIGEVKSAYDQATRFGQPIPVEISERVQDLSSQPAKQAKRRLQFIGAGIAIALIGIVVGVAWMMSSSSKATARQEKLDRMQQYVASEQYSDAMNFYSALQSSDPELAADPNMITWNASARTAIDEEASRIERFEGKVAQADTKDPALIDASLLPQLEELAVTPSEKAIVAALRTRKANYVADEALRQSDEMITKIGELKASFNELQSRGNSSRNIQAMEQLEKSVARLPNQYRLRSDDALARQETLRALVSSTIRKMKDESSIADQRSEAIEYLLSSRSLEVYADRLREYSTRSVSRTNFVEFQTVLDEERHWADVDRVNRWLKSLASTLANGVTSSEAASLIESAQELNSDIAPDPVMDAMPNFIPMMKEIVGRRVILEGAIAQIAKHPLARIVTLPIKDREDPSVTIQHLMYRTFAEQNADRMNRSGSIGVEVVSDALGGVRSRAFQGPLPEIENEPMASVTRVIDQRTAQAIGYDQEWERTFLRQVSDVMKRKNLDGVVKEWLVYQLLDAGGRGSERLRRMIPLTLRALARRSNVREMWFETRPRNTKMNADLERVIVAELNVAYRRFESPLADYEKVANQRLQWMGFLTKSMNGQIEYHLRGSLPEFDGTLYVAVPPREGDAETSILAVGKLSQGHVNLLPNPVYQVPGRPLFLFPN